MNLKEKVMLVQLNTSHWTARKFDKKVTQEIDENHSAHESGRFNKTLIISNLLKDVNTCVGKARAYHYKITIPWDDAGQRLLPVAKYFEYTKAMEEFQTEHKNLVRVFLKEYPDLRDKAKLRLNTLFNEADYPDVQSLAGKFNISYKITPIADSDDLRISLTKDEISKIKKDIQNGISEKINNAKNSIVERIKDVVSAMYEKLSDETATFRDSLVGNVVSLMELLPSLNFDEDEQLVELQSKLKKLNVPPTSLRNDMKLRKKTTKKAKKILKQVDKIYYGEKEIQISIEVEEKKEKKSKKVKRVKTKRLR